MKNIKYIFFLLFLSTQILAQKSIASIFENSEKIEGKAAYLNSPYTTAGDKLYMVGHQDGSFPALGWHINGEMGGIWCHPIKLMDGFSLGILNEKLDKANSFENFPFGNKITYHLPNKNIIVERYQFVPDGKKGIYIEFKISNQSDQKLELDLNLEGISNLMPTWLGERTQMFDSKDIAIFDDKVNAWISKDEKNTWFGIMGSSLPMIPNTTETPLKENKTLLSSNSKISIEAKTSKSFSLIISGSIRSKEDALNTYFDLKNNAVSLLNQKVKRLLKVKQNSDISLSDKDLEKGFKWIKYNTDWLIRDVDGQGRGLCAGLPDYPWWFGVDNEYTLKGLIATGQKDLVYQTIDLIHKLSEKTNGNGRIVHEVSTNGAVFNPGNVNETPQFASLIWEVFCWTGDKAFLNKYFPTIQKGLNWLMLENDLDKNLLPDGFGMMEIHGMNSEMIDVATYTQKAFADASKMAEVLGKKELSKSYLQKAEMIKSKINVDFWVPESNSFADFIGTKKQALHLVDDAIVRADTLKKPWAVAELKTLKNTIINQTDSLKRGYVMHHNWVVNTPMEMGIADKEKALKALETAKKYRGTYGMYVTGIDRDEIANADEGSFAVGKKIFNYTGAVMTLPTGVQAIAENNYGRPDEAYNLLKKMLGSFSYALPGSIYEVSPDFGMFSQAWNLYAFGEPIIKQFFGIKPMAHLQKIRISPQLPTSLHKGKISKVLIGTNILNMEFAQDQSADVYTLSQTNSNWEMIFTQPQGIYKKWMLNGKEIRPTKSENQEILKIKGQNATIKLLK